MMFSQQSLPILMALLIGVMPASVTAFAPLAPQAAANSRQLTSSTTTQRNLAVDPSDIASSVNQIAEHPIMEALISTLYAGAAKLPEAHGHSQSLFGPVDLYLTKMQSIVPATKGTLPTVIEESAIPDKIRGAFDFARRGDFVDPTNIVRIDGDAPPGFNKVDSFFPVLQPPPTSIDYQLGVMNQEVFNLRALQRSLLLPLLPSWWTFSWCPRGWKSSRRRLRKMVSESCKKRRLVESLVLLSWRSLLVSL
jgi:hypothetical protein